jgi:translation elongation factor EF-Tu-like GTPase
VKEIAKYYIEDKFIISNRGLAFIGNIVEGEISTGNYIEFNFFGSLIKRKIIGINLTSSPSFPNEVLHENRIGVLIECENQKEIKKIRESNLKNIEALIYEC